jgi:hypothetical protein
VALAVLLSCSTCEVRHLSRDNALGALRLHSPEVEVDGPGRQLGDDNAGRGGTGQSRRVGTAQDGGGNGQVEIGTDQRHAEWSVKPFQQHALAVYYLRLTVEALIA